MEFRAPAMQDAIAIEALTSETIRQIARRLNQTRSFEEFVYRESEMDALFSLADIAISTSRESEHPVLANNVPLARLRQLRELIFEAHDATHDNEVDTACELLERAAQLLERSP
ncbi:MAG TPA: hypothetical protein VMU99_00850 [Acidimicrobiales bacterium]|nr:hypothetical protein [Acidimicrobiales bacterium]